MDQRLNIPTYGKLYLLSTVILSLMVFSKAVDPYSITYLFKTTLFQLNLWRPFTAALYLSRIGIIFPFHIIFAIIAFSKSTKMFGQNRKGQFTWVFLLSIILLSIFSTFSSMYFFGNSFIMILLMMWAIQHSRDQFSFKNIRLPSIYFPLIYAATMILLGSSFKNYMVGFIFGLLLGVVKNPSYIEKNGDLFPAPAFIKNFFQESQVPNQPNYEQVRMERNPVENQQRGNNNQQRGSYFSGQGQRIG